MKQCIRIAQFDTKKTVTNVYLRTYLTTEEIKEIAKLIERGTGSKKNKYSFGIFDPAKSENKLFKSMNALKPLPVYDILLAPIPVAPESGVHCIIKSAVQAKTKEKGYKFP